MLSSMVQPGNRAWVSRGVAMTLVFAGICNVPLAYAQSAKVTIDNFTFGPAELTVTPDTTVTWSHADDIPHTVVSE